MTNEEALKQLQAEQSQYLNQKADYTLNQPTSSSTQASGDVFKSLASSPINYSTSSTSVGANTYKASSSQVINQPGKFVGAEGANRYVVDPVTRQATPVAYDQMRVTQNAFRNGGQYATPVFNQATQQYSYSQPSTKQITPVSKVELLSPLEPNFSQERLLGPSEFDKLRTQLGVNDSNFDQFFRRDDEGNIFLKGGVTPSGVDMLNLPSTGDRLLGPTEFNQLRKDLGVNESNFDQFFRRDDKGNIYLKTNTLTQPAGAIQVEGEVFREMSAEIFNFEDLTFPDMPQQDFAGFVNSMNRMFEITMTKQQQQYEQEQQRLYDLYQAKIKEVEQRPEMLRQLEDEYQVREQYDALSEMALQIQAAQADFDQLIYNQGQETINAGIIRGQQNATLQAKAVALGAMQGTYQAMAGNFEMANMMLDRALDVQFSSQEMAINMTRELISLNQDRLSKEESKQAFKIEAIMQMREQVLAEQRAEKEAIKSMMLEVAQLGGDPRGINFENSLGENMFFYANQMKVLNEQERQFRINEAKALAGVQVITDPNGKPIVALDLDGNIVQQYSGDTSNWVSTIGQVTGYGSSAWDKGLDIDVGNGLDQKIFSPVNGTVVDVINDQNGATTGFGNQVKILDDNNNEIWLSHLGGTIDPSMIGQRISAGDFVGVGGNTGFVMDGNGNPVSAAGRAQGVGSHLDVTMVKPDGSYYNAYEVEKYLNQQFSQLAPSQPGPFSAFDVAEQQRMQQEQQLAQQEASAQLQAEQGVAKKKIEELDAKLALINNIETSRGIDAVVGPNPGARSQLLNPVSSFISGTTADFIASVSSLIDKDSIDKLLAVKEQGGTFGALSDRELDVLRNSANRINEWIDRNDDGKIVGIKTSEKIFLEEIARIKASAEKLKSELSDIANTGAPSVDDYLNSILGS